MRPTPPPVSKPANKLKHTLSTKNTVKTCLLSLSLIISITLLSACGKKESLTPSASTVLNSTDALLTQAVIVDTITSICKKTGGDTAIQADVSRQQWFKHNWHWVDVADRHFSQKLNDKTFTYKNKPVALVALKLLADAELQARTSLSNTGPHSSSRKRACARKLAAIEINKYDQIHTPDIIASLQFVEKNLDSSSRSEIYHVPSLAGGLKLLDKPGRSYFSIEQRLIKGSCQNLQLFTLYNKWPIETYGAFCGELKSQLISCEWGQCTRIHGTASKGI